MVLLEVNNGKDNVEIVHWHYIRDKALETLKRQAEREGGQLLMLPSDASEEAGALSSRTQDLSSIGKDTDSSANAQGKIGENDAETKKFAPSERNKELKRIAEDFADRQDQLEQSLQKTRSDIREAEIQKKGSRGF